MIAAAAWRASSLSGSAGPTEGDHHSVGAAAQPQRVDLCIGEGRELLPQIGQPVGVELRPDGQRCLEPVPEPARPGHVQQMRAVDVEHVQRHRNLGDALRLGHQLLGQHRRRHDVEDVDGIEADRPVATQPSDWQRAAGRLEAGLVRAVLQGGEQGVAIREAAVERGSRHARGRRDVGERGGGRPLQHPLGRVEDALAVAQRVRRA